MSLTEGTQLGVYKITGKIGAGGMGEVYRATDTKLDREVAIKTLPMALASDSDRLARFEREAKLLAALNHPNIAAVHSLDEHEGTMYLAMELVEGETLEEKLKPGALPVEDALRLALQIGEALEAAHSKGVIHRDLKPANIMVNADGQVKVLDFGLAKAFLNEPEEASPGRSPALSLAMTQQGIILGTAGYMSPEQASGQPTDHRADVWAFGVVLYEMLTGLPLFSGESVPHILADVLRKEPEWERLPKNLHPRLKLMLERCLTKKPRDRYHSIADARVDIQAAISDPEGALVAQSAAAEPATGKRLSRLHLAAGIVATALAVGVGAWMLKPASPRAPAQIVYGTDTLPAGTFVNTFGRNAVSISRSGDRYAIRSAVDQGIYLRRFDDAELRVVPGTEGVPRGSNILAPDGQSIVYALDGALRRHPVSGGASVPLVASSNPFGMSWTDDGYILYSTGSEIRRVSENGGEAESLIQISVGQAQSPVQLPNGDWILYAMMDPTGRTSEESEIVIESPSTGERRTLRAGATDVRYTASGHLVYFFNGTLYAVPFDIDRLEITGGAVPVVVGVNSSVTGLGAFDISESGNLVYVPGTAFTSASSLQIVIADINGNRVPVELSSAAYRHVRSSPDGRFLAIDTANSGEDAIVWLYDSSGASAIRRLTFDGNNLYPVWSPDSEYVAFQSDRDGDLAVFRQRIDGTGGAERLTMPADGEAHIPESWSPDGKHLTFSVRVDDGYTLWVLSLEDMSVSRFSDIESTEPIGSVFSPPDGRWIAYHSLPVGASATNLTSGIYVEPFPATGARYQAPKVQRDFQPFWAPDGSALRYIGSTGSGQLATVAVNTESGFTFGAPVLTPFDLTAGRLSGDARGFDVLPDGRFVGPVFAENEGGTIAPEVRYVINWIEELKRLVPTD